MKKTEPCDKSLSLFVALKLEQRENRRLRKALRFYANEDAYAVERMGESFVVGTVVADRGGIARVALERRDRR